RGDPRDSAPARGHRFPRCPRDYDQHPQLRRDGTDGSAREEDGRDDLLQLGRTDAGLRLDGPWDLPEFPVWTKPREAPGVLCDSPAAQEGRVPADGDRAGAPGFRRGSSVEVRVSEDVRLRLPGQEDLQL